MVRLLMAILVGALLALGATFITGTVLLGVSNDRPVNSQLYNYGTR